MEQQVETIKQLADSYLKIVIKGIKDRVPKIITFLVINSTRKFIDGKMLTHFYQNDIVVRLILDLIFGGINIYLEIVEF